MEILADCEGDEGRCGRFPCSQNAHIQKVLVRCAQSKANHVHPHGVDRRGLNSKRCAFVEGRGHIKMEIACPRIPVIS